MSRWFVVPRPNPNARIRLFCFPYAGGGVSTYVKWQATLHPLLELVAVQPPGRGQRIGDPPHRAMAALQADLWPWVLQLLDRPYFLFGHSLGSRVAYELALRLRDAGKRMPTHFIASGSRAPHLPCRERYTYDLPDAEFVESLRDLNGTPEQILDSPELMELVMPVLRADFEIAELYHADPTTPFGCGATILGGTDDVHVVPNDLSAWQAHFRRPVGVVMCDGGHLFVDESPNSVISVINGLADRYLGFVRDSTLPSGSERK